MDDSRQEYPALLRSLPPAQAVSVLEERVKLIGKINLDIAEWLQERRRVEDAYVQGLRKLASKGSKEVSSELGVFRPPWQGILRSMESMAESHGLLAQKIESDVERPLKEYNSKNREMQAISTIQGNLSSLARDVEAAQRKASKLSGGKTSAAKVANATSDVDAANQQWDSQAPYVFEQLQALDESRINHLRDALTQLETHEADQVERNRTSAENCLNTILNVNTAEEISAFVARQTANAPPMSERHASRNRTNSTAGATSPPPELPAPAETPARKQPEDGGDSSPFSTSKTGPPPPSKKAFGGLRRLGTVFRPDKSSKGTDRPPSPEKRSRTGRNPLRRGHTSRQDMHQLESPPQSSSSNIPSRPPQLQDPLIQTSSTNTDEIAVPSKAREDLGESQGISMPPPRQSSIPLANGVQDTRNQSSVPVEQSAESGVQGLSPQHPGQGYDVAPNAVSDINRAQQEAAATEEGDPSQFKLNIQDAPIKDGDDMAQQSAYSTVANTLRSQAAPVARRGTTRGRRDVRNTIFVPSGQPIEGLGFGAAPGSSPPANIMGTPPLPAEVNRGSDAQSVRSAHSVSSTANTAISHPQMHQPGLNASIVETVSATFVQGQVTKEVVIGEMALQHNPPENAASPASESIRLENFPVLEKVAPNPTFITAKPSTSGEYSVNVGHATRPTVAFKYQVHLDEGTLGSHSPLIFTPSWKIEASQASVILTYATNPSFAADHGGISLRNMIVFVSVESTKANSCQSKPAGIFSKEKSLIYWKLSDLTVDGTTATTNKLLARFSTEGEAKAGNVEARWEISGDATSGVGSGLGLSKSSSGGEANGGSDPFADEDMTGTSSNWQEVPVTRRIVSGRYNAS